MFRLLYNLLWTHLLLIGVVAKQCTVAYTPRHVFSQEKPGMFFCLSRNQTQDSTVTAYHGTAQIDISYEELMCSFGERLSRARRRLFPLYQKVMGPLIKVSHSNERIVDLFTVEYKHSPGRAYGKLSINQPNEKLKETTLNGCVQA